MGNRVMEYFLLGRTGCRVSAISVGTVSLGMEYGIEGPGGCVRPTEAEALRLLNQALDAGINLFDTAPSYGDSERLLGQALGRRDGSYVATKVSIPRDGNGRPLRGGGLHRAVEASLEASLRALNREALDIVQIHNATVEVVTLGEMAEALLGAKRHGKVRYLGASVYTEAEALAVVEAGCFDVLQVAYSVLDQRMAKRVFSVAEEAGVGLMVRSSLLKGALTPRAQWLPPQLSLLYQAAEQAKELLAGSWQALPEVAVRFCLSPRQVATVLVGPRTERELNQALAAAEAGPLSEALVARALTLALADERLLNPSLWSSALATGTEG